MNSFKIRARAAISLLFAVLLCVVAIPASATDTNTVDVRVNGLLVDFPDQAPYINADGRTLIPVRFVAEQLDAKVDWDNTSRTAIIEKNGVVIHLPIGSKQMKVTEGGKSHTVTMDTEAVITGGRTMVPIRYVAEALGAYVDYADAFRVVGIYSELLTAAEIEELRSYGYTLPDDAITYEEYKSRHTEEEVIDGYGAYRETFAKNFANAHEYLYSTDGLNIANGHYASIICNDLGKTVKAKSSAEFYAAIAAEAAAEIAYSSKNLTITFKADQSCVYQPDTMDNIEVTVRGILTATWVEGASSLTGDEIGMLSRYGFKYLPNAKNPQYVHCIDIHLYLTPGGNVSINNVVMLAK